MKLKTYITLAALLSIYNLKAQVDSNQAKLFAMLCRDTTVQIGVFEYSSPAKGLSAMQDGSLPELDPKYVDVMLEQNLIKLKTEMSIRGNFDTYIFLKMKIPGIDKMISLQLDPVAGSRQVLFMKKCMSGNKLSGWVKSLTSKPSFVNPKSAFEPASYEYGTAYLDWPPGYERPEQFIQISPQFIQDLMRIIQVIAEIEKPGMSSQNQELVAASLLKTCTDPFGKAVATFVHRYYR